MKYFMYSDTASKPSSPNFVHRQFALKKTSDISERFSVHSVEFVEEAEAGRIKAATVRSGAPVLDPKPAKQSKGGGCTTTPAMKGDGHEHRRLVSTVCVQVGLNGRGRGSYRSCCTPRRCRLNPRRR